MEEHHKVFILNGKCNPVQDYYPVVPNSVVSVGRYEF